jgi:hypothetical protein
MTGAIIFDSTNVVIEDSRLRTLGLYLELSDSIGLNGFVNNMLYSETTFDVPQRNRLL